jgi:hypothetical protein
MWGRRSAIRAVPRHARLPLSSVAGIEATFGAADRRAQQLARAGFERLKTQQPALTEYLARKFADSLDDTALALGHMLAVAVFVGFEGFAGSALRKLSVDAVAAADQALTTDEELRRSDPRDTLDSEDIVAMDQPALVAFVNEHIGRVLDQNAEDVDVDDVALVFRAILVEIVALSHAIAPPPGHTADQEPMA